MAITHRILSRLHHEHFISGAQLAAELQLSRTAIWNHIEAIKALGIDVYSVKGKGYKLARAIDLLSIKLIRNAMSSDLRDEINYIFEPVLVSTNTYLLQNSRQLPNYTVCLCEQQSAGKGRMGRQWISPYGANIYMSFLWKTELAMTSLSASSLVVGLSIVEALHKFDYQGISIKWPNDIYKNGKKLAGVLVEVNGELNGSQNVIIGIGLNVHMPERYAEQIDQAWADLAHDAQGSPGRNTLVAAIITSLVANLQRFEQYGFAGFKKLWTAVDFLADKSVQVRQHDIVREGVSRGIDDDGSLLLEMDDEIVPVYAGEISCRLAE